MIRWQEKFFSPRFWAGKAAQSARMAKHRTEVVQRHGKACGEVAEVAAENTSRPLAGSVPDREVCVMAERRAELMTGRINALDRLETPDALRRQVNAYLSELQARPFPKFSCKRPEAEQLRGMLARAQCPIWWRRQLRRAVVREQERDAIHAGRVNARAGQWYCSDDTVRKRLRQNARNAEIMEATELENDQGQVFTVKALAELGTGNKAVRRGELMTRIRGCEEWAQAEGHRGVFLTLTAPSRFHQQLYKGGMNPNYRGDTPRDAQRWLCDTWARARARLARIGVQVYGFRVAEPHHDGCPHWHALVWAKPGQLWRLVLNLKRYWLKDCGDEQGAREHRLKAVLMRDGNASGYVAKYIAKNIDDAGAVGAEGHTDDGGGVGPAGDGNGHVLQGELWANPAARVEAWAAAWGIRQFQAIGQPPVTVWRELRRVRSDAIEVAPHRVALAWDGVNRVGEQRACWHTYLDMQGGTNTGRDYAIRVAKLKQEHHGRYEVSEQARPVGVYEAAQPDVLVRSERRTWKPRTGSKGRAQREAGALRAPQARAPWTRVNNCTHASGMAPLWAALRRDFESLNGGVRHWNHHANTPTDPPASRGR